MYTKILEGDRIPSCGSHTHARTLYPVSFSPSPDVLSHLRASTSFFSFYFVPLTIADIYPRSESRVHRICCTPVRICTVCSSTILRSSGLYI